ncbi:MAG: YcaQ family DNA glycosylase [Microthrixaceae bacterium]|nr:YcaQ family DNA glycosylase [Microthrixaceae bacterium]
MTHSLSASEARRIALAAQGFTQRRPRVPGTRHLHDAMARMGATQIDSVNVFARSHYMPFFSRLGDYDTGRLDALFFEPDGPYVEYLAHAATLLPISDWALFRFRMDAYRDRHASAPAAWSVQHPGTIEWVRAELAARGPLRAAEIEQDAAGGARGPWWDWSAVKHAVEHLWRCGEVAVTERRGFERRYALAEHVIPTEVLASPVPRDEAIRELIRRAARAYGVGTAADFGDYYRLRGREAVQRAIGELVDAGELEPVTVSGWERGDRPLPAWRHRDAVLPRESTASTILTPFDPLVWFRDRAERLFDFHYRIEIYTPEAKRRFGYYSLPVLQGERLVGRVDLKADRRTSTLLAQSAWWEPDAPPGAGERLGAVLREAAAWRGLESVSIGHRGDAADDLARAMPDAARHAGRG